MLNSCPGIQIWDIIVIPFCKLSKIHSYRLQTQLIESVFCAFVDSIQKFTSTHNPWAPRFLKLCPDLSSLPKLLTCTLALYCSIWQRLHRTIVASWQGYNRTVILLSQTQAEILCCLSQWWIGQHLNCCDFTINISSTVLWNKTCAMQIKAQQMHLMTKLFIEFMQFDTSPALGRLHLKQFF